MNRTKNLGLKPTLLYKDESDIMPFKNVVVPSSMRSPLWRYFGFPANEKREIITKSKIICCLCYQDVAYTKNTTNLASHLSHKHPEKYTELTKKRKLSDVNTESSCQTNPSKDVNWYSNQGVKSSTLDGSKLNHPTGINNKTYVEGRKGIYKPKFQIIEDIQYQTNNAETNENNSENEFIETDHDFINSDIDITVGGNEIISEVLDTDTELTANSSSNRDEFISAQYITIDPSSENLYDSTPRKILVQTKSTTSVTDTPCKSEIIQHDSAEITNQIKRFLIKDIVSSKIVDGTGFKEMINYFSPYCDVPSSTEIDEAIEKDYMQQNSKAISSVKHAITNRNFSLFFHKLGSSPMVQISVNYWLDGGDRISSLQEQMFCISKNCTNFMRSFGESLSNCSALLVDFNLKEDLDENIRHELIADIPIIPTFSYVTKMAFDACMQLSAIQSAVEIADGALDGKIRTSRTWFQKYEYLSQFLNEQQLSSEQLANNQIIQVLVECLQPLKNCLDVLAFETSVYASIMKPVALQLINQHYGENDESIETDIAVLEKDLKQSIVKVFQQHIIDNPFLAMASFLDPRFQRLTTPDDLISIRKELEKFEQSIPINNASSETKQFKSKLDKNFGLSSLFTNLSSAAKPKPPKNRLDIEFRSYTEDVSLDMELCPLEWWLQNETLYPSIKQHVKKYFCVPSFVNNLHRLSIPEQEELEFKYKRFENESANDKLLWLHLNALRMTSK